MTSALSASCVHGAATRPLICFEAADAKTTLPRPVNLQSAAQDGIAHESIQLDVCDVPEPVTLYVDYAYPERMNETAACVLFNPGGRGISNTNLVRWAARKYRIAVMSYDWPGRQRSSALRRVREVVDPFHNLEADVRNSYMYVLTNAAGALYRYWIERSQSSVRVLAGSSWGGVVGLLLSANYREHHLAHVSFGAGNFAREIPKRAYWDLWQDHTDPEIVSNWRKAFDPIHFAGHIKKPIVMATATNDRFFSLEMFESTRDAIDAPKGTVIAANCDHDMRRLNSHLFHLARVAARANSKDFRWLSTPMQSEVFATEAARADYTAWFALARGHNQLSRLWYPYSVDGKAAMQAAQNAFLEEHAPYVQAGDRVVSVVTYQQAAFGETFPFASCIREFKAGPQALQPVGPSSLDLRPMRHGEFRDRVAYRNAKGDPSVLRFTPGGEAHVTISGVFPTRGLATLQSEIRIVLDVVERPKRLAFCLLSDAGQASEAAWGCELPLDRPGESIEAVIPLSALRWMDLLKEEIANRNLPTRSAPETHFDPAHVSAACLWAPLQSGGAVRVVELTWRKAGRKRS
jgi:pimeloyl-ACP methyl ester carboxylesterase